LTEVNKEEYGKILRGVRNPSAYLGTELNSIRKNPAEVACSIALAFPDIYDIGMSHLGLKILYGLVNAHPDLAAERVFAPADDFAAALRERGMKLASLETRRPLGQFDFLGFTIPYELSYTTILWMLEMAGFPWRAADRGEGDPLVIGGGAGVYNPEPIAPFFDLLFLGEAETLLPEILRLGARKTGKTRRERLDILAKIDGVYVPSLYEVDYSPAGPIAAIRSIGAGRDRPKRVALPSMAVSPFPLRIVVPFGKPTHDRLNVEIDRGCVQGCRFCQAGSTYRPARERTPEEVMEIFRQALPATGYGEISLTSLSAGDYSQTGRLLTMLMDRYSGGKVAVSLPSLRPGSVTAESIEQIKRVRRTGFTITAEAGSMRLRNVINKKVTDEEIEKLALTLLENGWRTLKLYFMIGLPTETDEDVEAIATLALRLSRLRSANGGSFSNINVSAANFVPKAHTAFQWAAQDAPETLARKKERLFGLIRPHKKIKLKWTDPRVSRLEAVFAKGDRRLAEVIEEARRMGARLDPWSERRDMEVWRAAFAARGIDPAWYANRPIPLEEILPWSHLDTGLSEEYFRREYELSLKGEVTGDCKTERCLLCGLDPKTCFKPVKPSQAPPPAQPLETAPAERYRYRLTYHKKETGKFHGHLETMSIIQRAFRAAGLPVAHSEGFHPQPKISFGPALPVGVESAQETLDVDLTAYFEPWAVSGKLNAKVPDGFHFVDAVQIGRDVKSVSAIARGFTFRVKLEPPPSRGRIDEAVARFLAAPTAIILREGKRDKDMRPMIKSLLVEPGSLDLIYETRFGQAEGFARPDEMVRFLFPDGAVSPARMVKLSAEME
jgi:radical SAM family uncharacterized protein/radical SAM-linked protein